MNYGAVTVLNSIYGKMVKVKTTQVISNKPRYIGFILLFVSVLIILMYSRKGRNLNKSGSGSCNCETPNPSGEGTLRVHVDTYRHCIELFQGKWLGNDAKCE